MVCVHGEDSRTEGVCIQCAGMGGYARARTRRGCTLFRPRHRRTGAQTATDSARLWSASAACGMRTCDGYACVCRKVSWCFTPPRGWGPRRDIMLQWQHSSPTLHPPRHHTTTADPRHKELAQPRCLPAGTCVSRWRLPRAEGGQPSRRRVRCRRSLARHPCSHSSPCQVLAGAERCPQVRETTRHPCCTTARSLAPAPIFSS